MVRKRFSAAAALVPGVLFAAACSGTTVPDTAGPGGLPPTGAASGFNVLLVTVDTLRADRLGCYGHAAARTPNIDALASSGLRFEQATSAAPITLPSHASILTGLDPPSHGVRHNGSFVLPADRRTLAEVLRDDGYSTTAIVGAYVLDSRYGLDQGFEHYDDDVNSSGVSAAAGGYNERPADAVAEAALGWLNRHLDGPTPPPFLAWVHFFDPHAPYEPPGIDAAASMEDAYDGEIAFTDVQIGRLVEALRDRGVLDRTLVVFTSDHGEGLGQHDELTHADLIYDATMRVPLIFSSPRLFPEPVVIRDRISGSIDIFPTLLGILGIHHDETPVDGRDLFAAPPDPDRALYIETLAPLLDYGWSPLHGLRRLDDKLIFAPTPEYYDLKADPDETVNLHERSDRVPDLRRELDQRLRRWPPAIEVLDREQPMDAEQIERLASLGYVRSRPVRGRIGVRDPKEMMAVWRRMNDAGRLSVEGLHVRAIEAIREVLDADPDSAKAWYTALGIYDRAGRQDDAERCLRRALALSPKAEGYVILARFALNRGDREQFEAALRQAERLDPMDGGIYIGRGHDLALRGRLDEALRAFERAVEVDPVRSGPYAREQIRKIRQALGGTD